MEFEKSLTPYLDRGTARSKSGRAVTVDFYAQPGKMVCEAKVEGQDALQITLSPKGSTKMNFQQAVDVLLAAVERALTEEPTNITETKETKKPTETNAEKKPEILSGGHENDGGVNPPLQKPKSRRVPPQQKKRQK